MAKTKFTARLNDAVERLLGSADLRLVQPRSRSLYSPVFIMGKYSWAKVMDTDGLLLAQRRVHAGEGRAPKLDSNLLIGVVVQSEDATSQTKPNPLGKAALSHIPNGVWVDLDGQGRHRLDRIHVLFVLPKGAAFDRQKAFGTAKRNVENAAQLMPNAHMLEVPRGASAEKIANRIHDAVRPYFKGPGRPTTE